MYEVTIGQDMSCYATIEISEDTSLTRNGLAEIVNHVIREGEWDAQEVVFEPFWDSASATRVVSVRDEKGNYLIEDMAIDPSPYDAGQVFQSWLRGYGPTLQTVIKAAVEARLIEEPKMEAHTGYLELPGVPRIQIDFECRKGAAREEKDIAFLQALAKIATIDYVLIGEACHE